MSVHATRIRYRNLFGLSRGRHYTRLSLPAVLTQCSGWALKPGDVDPSLSPGERERERERESDAVGTTTANTDPGRGPRTCGGPPPTTSTTTGHTGSSHDSHSRETPPTEPATQPQQQPPPQQYVRTKAPPPSIGPRPTTECNDSERSWPSEDDKTELTQRTLVRYQPRAPHTNTAGTRSTTPSAAGPERPRTTAAETEETPEPPVQTRLTTQVRWGYS